jgi:thiol-disulfide isomerase/thioredoxin
VALFAFTGFLFTAGTPAWGAPTVAQMLGFHPRQEGVVCTTPPAEEQKDCKVELVKGERGGSGWLLKDKDGKPLRRYFDSNGDNRIDVWSYYKDGEEVYREIDTTFTGRPDQYRWLNAGGTRWGVDEAKDGHIKSWKVISPEEVSQEVLQALVSRDFPRLQALMVSEADLKALELPAEEANRLREAGKGAAARFQETAAKLTNQSGKANWLHLETGIPQCLPADQTGAHADLVKLTGGTILYEIGGANGWLQTGEMIQVGAAWRLVDAPVPGAAPADGAPAGGGQPIDNNPRLRKLIEDLNGLDKQLQAEAGAGTTTVAKQLQRADLLEKIVAEVKPDQRDPWIRQVADSLSTAAQNSPAGDTTAGTRLQSLEKQIVSAMAGSDLAAYVTFREMQADYSVKVSRVRDSKEINRVQEEWLDRLSHFVETYPKSDDTPDALLQLGMVSEVLSKEVNAKNWYTQLTRNFPDKPQAAKAAGALKRFSLEGQEMKLAGPTLADPATTYDVEQARGKVVVVYYWASWSSPCAGDLVRLKQLLESPAGKDVELVCVNLDSSAEEASKFLARTPVPARHLYEAKGLEGKLATDYGIMALPSLFLVGKDGKVVSRTAQVGTLEEEIKKLK